MPQLTITCVFSFVHRVPSPECCALPRIAGCRFRDRGALIMLLCPALMAIFMARAAALREQQGEGHSYAPGIMTGEKARG